MTQELKTFLKKNRAYFKLSTLEKTAGLPQASLTQILKNYPSRSLSEDQEDRIYKGLKTLADAIHKHLESVGR